MKLRAIIKEEKILGNHLFFRYLHGYIENFLMMNSAKSSELMRE